MAECDVTSLKALARARAQRQSLPGAVVTPALAAHLHELGARRIAGFLALPSEVDPLPALVAAQAAGADIAAARVDRQSLLFIRIDAAAVAAGAADVTVGALGVREPGSGAAVQLADCDAIVVPALACDLTGARLGRGGGYYDRALAGVAAHIPVIAVVHDEQVWEAGDVPVEPHDRRVTAIATPTRLILLGKR